MTKTLAVLLLLSLSLTACIVEPGGNRDHGWNNGDHAQYQRDQGNRDH